MNREDHLKWCKKRALEYVDHGNLKDAVMSMVSDLNKHPETKDNNGFLMMLGIAYVNDYDINGVRRWIQGFN